MFETAFYIGHNGNKIAYSDWGVATDQPIICVHGLTGNGFDFDFLARDLVKHGYRLICPDLAGRGRSDFLDDPRQYNYDQYRADLFLLLDHLGLHSPAAVDWIGVSLGGLLGIWIAGEEHSPIRRLILNDIGSTVPQSALDFIAQAIAPLYEFSDLSELEARMRATRGVSWGPVTNEQWAHMALHNHRVLPNGNLSYAYDHSIAGTFKSEPIGAVDLWEFWDKISCPVHLIRGEHSLVLPQDIVDTMRQRGPHFNLHVFEGCGHVPSLMAENQIEVIREWLYNTKT